MSRTRKPRALGGGGDDHYFDDDDVDNNYSWWLRIVVNSYSTQAVGRELRPPWPSFGSRCALARATSWPAGAPESWASPRSCT